MKSIFDISKKNIIIFGGAGKIGINFAKVLSEAGANVFILDLNCNKKFLNKKIHYLKCDVSVENEIKGTIDLIIKKFKKIDVLIYNVYSKPRNYYKDFINYEDSFYLVTETLLRLHYGEWQTDLITWYLYDRKDYDTGEIALMEWTNEDTDETKEVEIKTPGELWDTIQEFSRTTED